MKGQVFYGDENVQAKHESLFRKSTLHPIPDVLPVSVSHTEFNLALAAFRDILGADGVHTGSALIDYIDPFELWEDADQRHVPSAAIWYVPLSMRTKKIKR